MVGEGGDFQHPPRRIDAEHQILINHQPRLICEALNPPLLPSPFYMPLFLSFH
jgi:hypothetical protein